MEHISAQIGSLPSAIRLRPYLANSAVEWVSSGPPAQKVLFHPDPTGFEPGPVLAKAKDETQPPYDYVPFEWKEWRTTSKTIQFQPAHLPPTAGDYRIEALITDHYGRADDEVAENLFDHGEKAHVPSHGNVGGFARYTQCDPRSVNHKADYDTCLLSLGFAEGVIMWGDVGEFSLHIKPADLAARNFDDTLYYWDCC